MADDEFFGDLVSASARRKVLPVADGLEAEAQTSDGGLLITVTRGELEAMIEAEVSRAVETTFGKFVKSLRTVLGDMVRRLDAHTASSGELRAMLCELGDALQAQADHVDGRLTALGTSVRGMDKALQALRDHAELVEARELLGGLGADDSKAGGGGGTASSSSLQRSSARAGASAAAASDGRLSSFPSAVPPAAASQAATSPSIGSPASSMPPTPAPSVEASAPMQAAPSVASAASVSTAPPMTAPVAAALPPYQPPPQQLLYAPPAQHTPAGAHPPGGYANPVPMPHHAQMHQQPQQQQHAYAPQGQPQRQFPIQGPPLQQPWLGSAPPTSPGYPPAGAPIGASPHPQYCMPSFRPSDGGQGTSGTSGPPRHAPDNSGGGGARTSTRAVPLEQIISDICAMGFERRRVMTAMNDMQRSGAAIDLNVIIDKLTRGEY